MEKPAAYYVLGVEDPDVGYRARLVYERDKPLRSWMSGQRFDEPPPEPIALSLSGTDEKNWVLPDLWLTPIAVMSRRLLNALRGAGVDTFDTYAVTLRDPVSGKVYDDFVAFNITRKIAVESRKGRREDLDALLLDEAKTGGALLFRAAEALNAVLIHDAVCEAISNAGIETLTFYEASDWVG